MYIDGYNFYYAVKDNLPEKDLNLGWCDFGRLATRIVRDRGEVSRIKYFTAPVENLGKLGGEAGSERERQALWLRAVGTIRPTVDIVEGFHSGDHAQSPPYRHKSRSEKATDVNIAIALVLDAAKRVYDRAILVSGDYDQMPTVEAVTKEFMRPVEIWLPPGHAKGKWADLERLPLVTVHSITTKMLAESRLSENLRDERGRIEVPSIWRAGVRQ